MGVEEEAIFKSKTGITATRMGPRDIKTGAIMAETRLKSFSFATVKRLIVKELTEKPIFNNVCCQHSPHMTRIRNLHTSQSLGLMQ